MLILHLHWGQEEIQKGHVACFEGVIDIINKEVKHGIYRKTFKSNCDVDDKCEEPPEPVLGDVGLSRTF